MFKRKKHPFIRTSRRQATGGVINAKLIAKVREVARSIEKAATPGGHGDAMSFGTRFPTYPALDRICTKAARRVAGRVH